MFVRVCAFVIWALVAGTIVFWGLRLLVRSPQAPAHVLPVGMALASKVDLGRLLGATATTTTAAVVAGPEAASRFRLLGVMAPRTGPRAEPSGQGVALIAVDGKPARAFAVGARLDDDLVLQAVSLRSASIGPPQGQASVRLEIPPLPAPATGVMPPAAAGTAGVSVPTMAPPAPPVAAPPPLLQPPQPSLVPGASPNPSATRRDPGASSR